MLIVTALIVSSDWQMNTCQEQVCVLCVGVYYLHYYSVCDVLITISHVLLSPETISMLKCD